MRHIFHEVVVRRRQTRVLKSPLGARQDWQASAKDVQQHKSNTSLSQSQLWLSDLSSNHVWLEHIERVRNKVTDWSLGLDQSSFEVWGGFVALRILREVRQHLDFVVALQVIMFCHCQPIIDEKDFQNLGHVKFHLEFLATRLIFATSFRPSRSTIIPRTLSRTNTIFNARTLGLILAEVAPPWALGTFVCWRDFVRQYLFQSF
jgi:hypothetical protein